MRETRSDASDAAASSHVAVRWDSCRAHVHHVSREGPPRATDQPPGGHRAERAWGDRFILVARVAERTCDHDRVPVGIPQPELAMVRERIHLERLENDGARGFGSPEGFEDSLVLEPQQ